MRRWPVGWVDGDARAYASSGIGLKQSTACLVSGPLGGDEACNAWLHHACLRTKGRMVSTHNHEIASLRASRGGGAALTLSSTAYYECVLHTHMAVIHLYAVIIGPELPYLHTYLCKSKRIFASFLVLPLDARDICHWSCQARNGAAPDLLSQRFRAQTPARAARIGPNRNPSA